MEKLIEFKNLTIKKDAKILYENVNLSLFEGDRLIYLGPNGIGKSLLLELLFMGYCGDLANRYKGLTIEGQILDGNGKNLLDPSTSRVFAYAHQEEDFYENTTVYDEAESACAGVGLELDETELDEYLDCFGLLEKKKKKIKRNVSYGEGKIIHLICVLLKLKVAPVLLLDEPLNHLSFRNSQLFNKLINRAIQKNPKLAIIMVSHCRAMDFTNKAMVYDEKNKTIVIKEYQAYNCFSDELGHSLGCCD